MTVAFFRWLRRILLRKVLGPVSSGPTFTTERVECPSCDWFDIYCPQCQGRGWYEALSSSNPQRKEHD